MKTLAEYKEIAKELLDKANSLAITEDNLVQMVTVTLYQEAQASAVNERTRFMEKIRTMTEEELEHLKTQYKEYEIMLSHINALFST